jgi:hypothetical protein
MDDDRIEPVQAVDGDTPVSPVDAIRPRPRPAVAPVGDATQEPTLGARATRAELETPVPMPASCSRVANVHDAARHGEPLAEAIERAHTADPSDRAQQLGGAAASAASGQATPPVGAGTELPERRDEVEPLAPVAEIAAEHSRE